MYCDDYLRANGPLAVCGVNFCGQSLHVNYHAHQIIHSNVEIIIIQKATDGIRFPAIYDFHATTPM